MKIIFCFLTGLTFSNVAFAAEKCFEFDAAKFSKGLGTIHLSLTESNQSKAAVIASIVAQKSTARSTSTKFDCKKTAKLMSCVQPDGGGEFALEIAKDGATIKLSYVNLIIGSSGTAKLDKKSEITEEFAIFDIENSDETDATDEPGELEEVRIQGKEIKCPLNH